MRWLSICVVLAALPAAPNAVLAKGEHFLHLFPEQTASVSHRQRVAAGDFLRGWGRGGYREAGTSATSSTRSRSGPRTARRSIACSTPATISKKDREIFAQAVKHRPRIRLAIRQRTRVLERWPKQA
jgi:hypothetical protein